MVELTKWVGCTKLESEEKGLRSGSSWDAGFGGSSQGCISEFAQGWTCDVALNLASLERNVVTSRIFVTSCRTPWSCLPWHVSQFFPPLSVSSSLLLPDYHPYTCASVCPRCHQCSFHPEHQSPKKMHCFNIWQFNLSFFGGFGSFNLFESGGSSFGCSGFDSFFASFHFRFLIFTGWWLVWIPWTIPDMRKHVQVPNHETHIRNLHIYVHLSYSHSWSGSNSQLLSGWQYDFPMPRVI